MGQISLFNMGSEERNLLVNERSIVGKHSERRSNARENQNQRPRQRQRHKDRQNWFQNQNLRRDERRLGMMKGDPLRHVHRCHPRR